MNFIKKPNLPENNVKYVVCDCRTNKRVVDELDRLGISVIGVPVSDKLQKPVSAHADIHVCHTGHGRFTTSVDYCEIFTNTILNIGINCEKFHNSMLSMELGEKYPEDVPLNCVFVNNYLICNPNTVASEILSETTAEIIAVKQGYTKCSTCVVSDSAIITDDLSIKRASEKKLDVLYIEHSQVILDGYNYGFIGGCCGKLSKDILAFTGNLEASEYSESVKSFCRNHKVNCISLSKAPLYDYGSLLPIIED